MHAVACIPDGSSGVCDRYGNEEGWRRVRKDKDHGYEDNR